MLDLAAVVAGLPGNPAAPAAPAAPAVQPAAPVAPANDGPDLSAPPIPVRGTVDPSLAQLDTGAQAALSEKPGIFDRIHSALQDPDMRAALLRSGAATLSSGDVGAGILAGANFYDERGRNRASAAEDRRRFDAGDNRANMLAGNTVSHDRWAETHGDRALGEQAREADQSNATSRRGQTLGYQGTHEGHVVSRENAQDQNRTQIVTTGMHEAGANTRERMGNQTQLQTTTMQGQTSRDVANINANAGGEGRFLKDDQVNAGLAAMLPGLYGADGQAVHKALQTNPEVMAVAMDAYRKGYGTQGDGKGGSTQGALAAVKSALAPYKFDAGSGGFLGFGASDPGFHRQGGGGGAVRTATNPQTGEKVQLVNGHWVPVK